MKRQHISATECLDRKPYLLKTVFSAFFILFFSVAFSQRTNRHTPVIKKGFYLSINTFSIVEAEQGGAGMGIGYRFNKRIELFSELNSLYRGFFMEDGQFEKLKGFRLMISGKYFYQNKYGFFVGAEFRWKQYSFNDETTFVNDVLNDTLFNYRYQPRHNLLGGAVFWGKRFKLTPNGKWELEGQIGIGAKYRQISRNGVPAGYDRFIFEPKDRISPIPDRDVNQVLPYFPGTIRILFHL